jgi:hypothetical protein
VPLVKGQKHILTFEDIYFTSKEIIFARGMQTGETY